MEIIWNFYFTNLSIFQKTTAALQLFKPGEVMRPCEQVTPGVTEGLLTNSPEGPGIYLDLQNILMSIVAHWKATHLRII